MPNHKKILLIEDNEQYRKLLSDSFTAAGFEIKEAADGVSGLSLAQVEAGFDVILMDLKIPNIDGLELIKKLMEKPTVDKNGPIIALTSVTQDYIKEEVVRRGALEVIAKDEVTPDQLIEKVNTFIQEHPLKKLQTLETP